MGIMDTIPPIVPCVAQPDLVCVSNASMPEMTTYPVVWDAQSFWCEYAIIAFSTTIYLALYSFLSVHRLQQRRQEAASLLMSQCEGLAVDFVRHLVPSMSISGYRFRGMRPKSKHISLEFQDLGLRIHGSKVVALEGVTGAFQACHMAAVMGPSGSGKTTFLNVLCGKAVYGTTEGSVRINGKDSSIHEIRSVLGFVPQDDIVHQELTVREQIFYSAQLRNPAGTSRSRIDRIVEDVLHVMQIERIQHSIVGNVERRGVSGGERKRVNIGLELAACPTVLFLDEPTSGLDATSALGVVNCLKKLTQLGMTVAMSIHQPRYSLFTLFDEVILLGKGGRTVYLGPSHGALPYFQDLGFLMREHENPADWIMDAISGGVVNERYPDLKPEVLSGHWARQCAGHPASTCGARSSTPSSGALQRSGSDLRTISDILQDAWSGIDVNGCGHISQAQLGRILASIPRVQPSEAVVCELFARMGGKEGIVTKTQFLNFLINLGGSFAQDGLTTPSEGKSSSRLEDAEAQRLSEVEEELDLSRPGCFRQFMILLHRNMVRWNRQCKQKGISIFLSLLAAVVFGQQCRGKIDASNMMMPLKVNLSNVAVGLMVGISCLDVFGNDRPLFWREASSGINVLAFFMARILLNFLDVWLMSLLFSIVWYVASQPDDSFWLYHEFFRWVAFNAAAWGYLISSLVRPTSSTLACAVTILILGGAFSEPQAIAEAERSRSWLALLIPKLSPFTWSAGAVYLRIVDLHGGAAPQAQDQAIGYRDMLHSSYMGYMWTSRVALVLMWVTLLIAGFFGLKLRHRERQV